MLLQALQRVGCAQVAHQGAGPLVWWDARWGHGELQAAPLQGYTRRTRTSVVELDRPVQCVRLATGHGRLRLPVDRGLGNAHTAKRRGNGVTTRPDATGRHAATTYRAANELGRNPGHGGVCGSRRSRHDGGVVGCVVPCPRVLNCGQKQAGADTVNAWCLVGAAAQCGAATRTRLRLALRSPPPSMHTQHAPTPPVRISSP